MTKIPTISSRFINSPDPTLNVLYPAAASPLKIAKDGRAASGTSLALVNRRSFSCRLAGLSAPYERQRWLNLIAARPDALRNCSAETPGALAAFELTEL